VRSLKEFFAIDKTTLAIVGGLKARPANDWTLYFDAAHWRSRQRSLCAYLVVIVISIASARDSLQAQAFSHW
jgi:hypothetical protein